MNEKDFLDKMESIVCKIDSISNLCTSEERKNICFEFLLMSVLNLSEPPQEDRSFDLGHNYD